VSASRSPLARTRNVAQGVVSWVVARGGERSSVSGCSLRLRARIAGSRCNGRVTRAGLGFDRWTCFIADAGYRALPRGPARPALDHPWSAGALARNWATRPTFAPDGWGKPNRQRRRSGADWLTSHCTHCSVRIGRAGLLGGLLGSPLAAPHSSLSMARRGWSCLVPCRRTRRVVCAGRAW
jgi:hypothetical protein